MCIIAVGGLVAAGFVGRWIVHQYSKKNHEDTSAVDDSSTIDDSDPETGNNFSTIEPTECDVEPGQGDLVSAGDDIESERTVGKTSHCSLQERGKQVGEIV